MFCQHEAFVRPAGEHPVGGKSSTKCLGTVAVPIEFRSWQLPSPAKKDVCRAPTECNDPGLAFLPADGLISKGSPGFALAENVSKDSES